MQRKRGAGESNRLAESGRAAGQKKIWLLWGLKAFVKMFYRMLQPSVVADGWSLTHVTINKNY